MLPVSLRHDRSTPAGLSRKGVSVSLLRSLCCGAVLCAGVATPVLAQSAIEPDITYDFYELDSDTLPELQAEMNLEGPNGFPAYTTWYVNWTTDCEVTVTATITLPDLGPDANLTPQDRETFRAMLESLETHEENHVEFGIGFAEDVRDMGCQGDTAAVLQEWLAEERQYDTTTNHGETEGAWLEAD
jgi:predicted secreted Zn-dependent protease